MPLSLLCLSPRTGLGLLVAAFEWGGAVWQVATGGLVNVFVQLSRGPALPDALQSLDWSLLLLDCTGEADEARLVTRSPPARDVESEDEGEVADEALVLGRLVVSTALGWRAPASPSVLVQRFAVTRAGCEADGDLRAGGGGGEGQAGGEGQFAVALAGCSSRFAALSAAGRVHVWAHGSADCLLTLSIADANPWQAASSLCLAGAGEALLLLLAPAAGRTVSVVTKPLTRSQWAHGRRLPAGLEEALARGQPGEGLVGAVPLAVCAAGAHGPSLPLPGLAWGPPHPPAEAAGPQGPARPPAASQSLSGFPPSSQEPGQDDEATPPQLPAFVYPPTCSVSVRGRAHAHTHSA